MTRTPSPRAISPVPSVELLSNTNSSAAGSVARNCAITARDRRRLVETRDGDGDPGGRWLGLGRICHGVIFAKLVLNS